MREVMVSLHRDLPPAKLWSYAAGDGRHGPISANPLSPVIEVRSHQPVEIEWVNLLPERHLFTIDHSLHGCGPGVPDVRAVVHLHGARTRTRDDGYPEDWYLPGRSRVCRYPMQQEATALWYHDHAMGINRLNTYAGLAGMVLVRDAAEDPSSFLARLTRFRSSSTTGSSQSPDSYCIQRQQIRSIPGSRNFPAMRFASTAKCALTWRLSRRCTGFAYSTRPTAASIRFRSRANRDSTRLDRIRVFSARPSPCRGWSSLPAKERIY
jgi:hypothetical protein